MWPIGPNLPDKHFALHIHNHTEAKTKGIGPFTLDDTQVATDYYLIERTTTAGHEITFALYQPVDQQHGDGGS